MFHTKFVLSYLLKSIIVLGIIRVGYGLSLDEVIQSVREDDLAIRTAHVISTEEETRSGLPADLSPASIKAKTLNLCVTTSVDSVFDFSLQRIKKTHGDLRNLKGLMANNHLPPEQLGNLSRNSVELFDRKWQLVFQNEVSPTLLVEPERDPVSRFLGQKTRLTPGNINPIMFDGVSAELSQAEWGNKPVTKIVVNRYGYETTYYADPKLGYRYLRREVRLDGKIVRTEDVGEYKIVDGIPYPFQYSAGEFDPATGAQLRTLKVITKEVHLNIPLDDAVFSILVPANTRVVGSKWSTKIPVEMSIDLNKVDTLPEWIEIQKEVPAGRNLSPALASEQAKVLLLREGNLSSTSQPAQKAEIAIRPAIMPHDVKLTNMRSNYRIYGIAIASVVLIIAIACGVCLRRTGKTTP